MLKLAGLLFKMAIVLPIAVALLATALLCLWPERKKGHSHFRAGRSAPSAASRDENVNAPFYLSARSSRERPMRTVITLQ